MNKNKVKKNQQSGSALMITVLILASLFIAALNATSIIMSGILISGTQERSTLAFYAAESGAERAAYEVLVNGNLPALPAPSMFSKTLSNGSSYVVNYATSTFYSEGSFGETKRSVSLGFETGVGGPALPIYCDGSGSAFVCGDSCEYNGDSYSTVQIDTQCWFAENLRTTKYPDGTDIVKGDATPDPTLWNNSATAYYSCPPNTANNAEDCAAAGGATKLGMFYQWPTIMKTGLNNAATASVATGNGPQGLCPVGWQVPTDDNTANSGWGKLYSTATSLCGAGQEGTCLKTGGASGFNMPLSGIRNNNGNYGGRASYVNLWSSSQLNATTAWSRLLYTGAEVYRYNSYDKTYGFSVRCLKN